METKSPQELNLQKLTVVKVLGKGAMGTVFLVTDRVADTTARSPFALKVVQKSTFHTKFDADRRARWEISVLSRLKDNPFLPTLIGTLETEEYIAWGVPYCSGGDLNVLRYRQNDRVFSPSVIRFYVAEIVCAIEYLHHMNIVYRDLKPENVLIQQSGHIILTDFDLSRTLNPKTYVSDSETEHKEKNSGGRKFMHKRNLTRVLFAAPEKGLKKIKSARVSPVSRKRPSFITGERSNSFVGTEEYVSPEVVRGDGHEFAVDWWALGILMYEMSYGKTPFRGANRKETFRNVLSKPPEFIGKRTAMTDLIQRLLDKDPTKRLGYNYGAVEIKEHEFFRGLRWDLLTEVSRPPFLKPLEEYDLMVGKIDIAEYFRPEPVVPTSPLNSTYNSPSPSLAEF
ncbi:hypothetical protein IFM89_036257 [Coptis chinensis]|uniref:non-specific serine/threonine protein kinase n=1 Tax=Coptis chinensis TaxID=261450 RepID=A0A835LNP5_9MAGN|nr:hypothetical protein IFM89_036257 [Coptis chinensis]